MLFLLLACHVDTLLVDEVYGPPCDARAAFYRDADGDGAGDEASVAITCEAPEGYVAAAGDCDDADPARTTVCGDSGSTETGPDDSGPADSGG